MLEIASITMPSVVIRAHVGMLGLDARRHGVARAANDIAALAHIPGRAWQVGSVVSGRRCCGLGNAFVLEANVLGALVWAWHRGDGIHHAGIVGHGRALGGHFGESAALVGVLLNHFGGESDCWY